MSIRTLALCIISCDGPGCHQTLLIEEWQKGHLHDWCVPCDGMVQLCPTCLEKKKQGFRELLDQQS